MNAPATREAQMRRIRSVATLILVILASLGVVVSLVGIWVRATLFDTDSFLETVETTLTSDEVTAVVADALTEQATTALDVEGRLETRLAAIDAYFAETLADTLDLSPAQRNLLARIDLPAFASLAQPIAEPIEQRIEESISALVASAGFQERLPDAIAFAHRGAVALIRNGTEDLENVTIVAGEVRWNILPLVAQAIGHVFNEGILDPVIDSLELSAATYAGVREDAVAELSDALSTVLPDGFGQVTVMSEERLESWQAIARNLDRTAVLAVGATIALLTAALLLSSDRRRTLVQFTLGVAVALLAAAIVQNNALEALDEAIPGPEEQAAAEVLFQAVLANLRSISWVFVAVAAVAGLSAHLAGRPAWLETLRRKASDVDVRAAADRIVVAHSDAFIAGGVATALLVWWRVGFSTVSLITVGLLLGAYLWYIIRLATRTELPTTDRT
ncbi:MAG: hypothetical protein QNJ81_01455 [Acidimicrobiia bacterium]|nr:hypothetical protein [Acidimicrobiia bacterium]